MLDQRNQSGLTPSQTEQCIVAWELLGGSSVCRLDTSRADRHCSRTRFVEDRNVVVLGADVLPGSAVTARSRMSMLACLAHELAHAARFARGYRRPLLPPDMLLDEGEASVDASFNAVLAPYDRRVLIEDAQEQLSRWLVFEGVDDAN